MKLVVGTLLLLSLAGVSGKFIWGSCPDIEPIQEFKPASYMGVWWEAMRIKNTPFEHGDCAHARYTLNEDGTIKVVNSGVKNSTWSSVVGEAYCDKSGSTTTGACHVRFSEFSPYGPYNVLATDYENYAVVYGCSNYYIFHITYAWVLERKVGGVDVSNYIKYFEKDGLTLEDFHLTTNKNCPPFPN